MKRLLLLCLTAFLALTLVACDESDTPDAAGTTYEVNVLRDNYTLTIDGKTVTVVQKSTDRLNDYEDATAVTYEKQTGTLTEGEEFTSAVLNKPTYRMAFEGENADEALQITNEYLDEIREEMGWSEEEYRRMCDLCAGKEVTDLNPNYLTEITFRFDDAGHLLILSTTESDGDLYRYTYYANGAVETRSYYYEDELRYSERYDQNGNYIGEVDSNAEYTYYDNGNIKTKITRFDNGSIESELTYAEDGALISRKHYHENGNLETDATFYPNGNTKTYLSYDYDGSLSFKEEGSEDRSTKTVTSYSYDYDYETDTSVLSSYRVVVAENDVEISNVTYDPDGNLLSTTSYEYYDDGTVKKETAKNADGIVIEEYEYYESSMVKSESYYSESGKLEARNEYDEACNKIRYTYRDGEASDDLFTEEYTYDDIGRITKVTYYQNDVLTHYTLSEYTDDGSLTETSYYADETVAAIGRFNADGKRIFYEAYHENGALSEKHEYHENGNTVKEETYDENGNVLSFVTYDENGNVLRDFSTDEDGNTALYENTYNEEGTLIFYAIYRNDLPVRKYEYFDDGGYKAEYSYHDNGQLYQEFHYHENGNYRIQGTYHKDGSIDYYCEMNEENRTTLAKYQHDGILIRQEFTYRADGSFTINSYNDATNALIESQEYDADGNLVS